MKILFCFLLFISIINASQILYNDEEKAYLTKKQTITMCVDNDWEPFEKVDTQGNHVGIAGDIIRLIAKRGNIDIELLNTKDWKESLEYSKLRNCDILSFLNDIPERRKWLTFTEPIFSDPNVLVGRIERKYITNLENENLTIALLKNTAILERFKKEFPNLHYLVVDTEAQAFKLVEEKKADVTLRSLIVTAYTIKKEALFNLKIVGEPKGYENLLRIGVRNDEPILKDILNKAIQTLTKDDIDTIVNQHVKIVIEKNTNLEKVLWVISILVFIIGIILLWNYLLNKKVKEEVAKNIEKERLLKESAKKAEIGELVANISHQWKNGLTQISSLNLELILMGKMNTLDKETLLDRLNKAEQSISFMSKTMDVFLNFYKDRDNNSTFSIKENIEQVLQLIDIKIKNSNTTISIKEIEPMNILGNKNEWIHIWLNLINNTISAFEKNNIKGALHISIDISSTSIVYRDNAGGINETILKQLHNNTLTGLGIKMTQEILKQHHCNGIISNLDNGIIFTIKKL